MTLRASTETYIPVILEEGNPLNPPLLKGDFWFPLRKGTPLALLAPLVE
jgi:hypothetical protein